MTERETTLPSDDLKALFDITTKTGSFVSGLLCQDDIEVIRRVAATIGADPMEGTPSAYAGSYPHPWKQHEWDDEECGWDCRKPKADPIHATDNEPAVAAAPR